MITAASQVTIAIAILRKFGRREGSWLSSKLIQKPVIACQSENCNHAQTHQS